MNERRPYNRVRDVLEGLQIFAKYGAIDVSAEHDVLYGGQPSGVAITEEERAILLTAGWHNDSEFCECNARKSDDDEPQHELTCAAWAIFT